MLANAVGKANDEAWHLIDISGENLQACGEASLVAIVAW